MDSTYRIDTETVARLKALEISLEEVNPDGTDLGIVSSDYIQVPGQRFLFPIGESDKGLNYSEANKAVLKRGLAVPRTSEFMATYNHIVDSERTGTHILDTSGNPLNAKTQKDLYRRMTSDCYIWNNGLFHIRENSEIEYIIGIDQKGTLLTSTEYLENCLMEECCTSIKRLTKQGFPKSNARLKKQEFSNGKNIYNHHPLDGRVAEFYADSGGSYLDCDTAPSCRDPDLGVFAIKHF